VCVSLYSGGKVIYKMGGGIDM